MAKLGTNGEMKAPDDLPQMLEGELLPAKRGGFIRRPSLGTARGVRRELAAVGVQAHVVGAGFAAGGQPPLAATVTALHAIGIDARSVLSTRVDEQMVADADLVLTAERLHVVRLVEGNRDLLAKVFTCLLYTSPSPRD